jgi:hypothetical protein
MEILLEIVEEIKKHYCELNEIAEGYFLKII